MQTERRNLKITHIESVNEVIDAGGVSGEILGCLSHAAGPPYREISYRSSCRYKSGRRWACMVVKQKVMC